MFFEFFGGIFNFFLKITKETKKVLWVGTRKKEAVQFLKINDNSNKYIINQHFWVLTPILQIFKYVYYLKASIPEYVDPVRRDTRARAPLCS